MDPDPEDQKTCGSCGSGSQTLPIVNKNSDTVYLYRQNRVPVMIQNGIDTKKEIYLIYHLHLPPPLRQRMLRCTQDYCDDTTFPFGRPCVNVPCNKWA
jgi:hypothetical protein